MKKLSESGQTLIELVISLGLVTIVVTALIGIGVMALKTAISARNRVVAAKLASEELELVRAYRDANGFTKLHDDFLGLCTAPCYVSGGSIFSGTETVGGIFSRFFTLGDAGAGKLEVEATTQWAESGGTKSVSVTSYLADWR